MKTLALLIGLALCATPLAGHACGPIMQESEWEALGYTKVSVMGAPRHVLKVSRRQLQAMTKIGRERELFGFLVR